MVAPAKRVCVLFGLPYDPDVRVRRVTHSLAGAGYDVTVTPSAQQVDRDLPIRYYWPSGGRGRVVEDLR